MFGKLDADENGTLDKQELMEGLDARGCKLTDEECASRPPLRPALPGRQRGVRARPHCHGPTAVHQVLYKTKT